MDEAVLDALGMAMAFQGISGPPPSELLRRLKQGPGGHLRTYAPRLATTGEIAVISFKHGCLQVE